MRMEFVMTIVLFVVSIIMAVISHDAYENDHIGKSIGFICLFFLSFIAALFFLSIGIGNIHAEYEEKMAAEETRLLAETPDGYMLCNLTITDSNGFKNTVKDVYITTETYEVYTAGETGRMSYRIDDFVYVIDMKDVTNIEKVTDKEDSE